MIDRRCLALVLVAAPLAAACQDHVPRPLPRTYDKLSRRDFNRMAVRSDEPVFWVADTNANKRVDPDEVVPLLLYTRDAHWVDHRELTTAFDVAYNVMLAAKKEIGSRAVLAPDPPSDPDRAARRAKVGTELDLATPALIRTELHGADGALAAHLIAAARRVDLLYDRQTGAAALADRVGVDLESQRLLRRNHGPRCVTTVERDDTLCSAVPGMVSAPLDVYPAQIQGDPHFCDVLSPAARAPYSVLRAWGPEPYNVAYEPDMVGIATELAAAAQTATPALAGYLHAAAHSFRSNDWEAADAAWQQLTAQTSTWYLRVAPDDASWEPCGHKAGFHLVLARFVPDVWTGKLAPLAQELEASVAALAGGPYAAREVTLHVPEPAELVLAAGYDHRPEGAPLLERHGARSIAFTNIGRDPDSRAALREPVASVLDAASLALAGDGPEPGLLVTTLDEVARQLGPTPDAARLGEPFAAVLADAQREAIALHLIALLRARGIIDDELATRAGVEAIGRLLGRARELFDAAGARETAPHAPAIVIGALVEAGVLVWSERESANHSPSSFALHLDRLGAASGELVHQVVGIVARGDRTAATALAARYADETYVPFGVLAFRARMAEPPSFVYAVIP